LPRNRTGNPLRSEVLPFRFCSGDHATDPIFTEFASSVDSWGRTRPSASIGPIFHNQFAHHGIPMPVTHGAFGDYDSLLFKQGAAAAAELRSISARARDAVHIGNMCATQPPSATSMGGVELRPLLMLFAKRQGQQISMNLRVLRRTQHFRRMRCMVHRRAARR
jgi:hypothetical protein